MEKIAKISILGRESEFEMEKIAKISNLGIKREFKMEKTVEISILERKREFKMEKQSKFPFWNQGVAPRLVISYNPPYVRK